MTNAKPIRRIAIIGTGVIGASWTSLFLAKGLQVVATDIAPNAEAALRKFVETAWPALKRLGLSAGASQSNLKFTADLTQAVAGVDLVQENGPERTVRVKKEMPGHVANRLQAALAREVYYLVAEGVVSAADVDTALCWGPGLRWGVMGNMMLNHLGGGPGGIEHFFQQFTGPMTAWWKTLGSPVLTSQVQKKLIDSVHAEVGSRTIEELEAERDEMLLGLLEIRTKGAKTAAEPKTTTRVA